MYIFILYISFFSMLLESYIYKIYWFKVLKKVKKRKNKKKKRKKKNNEKFVFLTFF